MSEVTNQIDQFASQMKRKLSDLEGKVERQRRACAQLTEKSNKLVSENQQLREKINSLNETIDGLARQLSYWDK